MKTCLFAFLLLLASTGIASACSCFPTVPLDKEFADSENVVIMKLTAVTKADGTENYAFIDNVKQSTLTVEKVFKGKLEVGQQLPFKQGGGADCVWTFSEGEIGTEYLLFLGPGKAIWAVSVCSRSSTVKGAAADIRYLENIATIGHKTRLYGTLEQVIKSPTENSDPDFRLKSLADKTVRITGMGRNLSVKTDADGTYEVYGLPPGRYRVEPEKVKGFRPENDDYEKIDALSVKVFPRSHTEANFDFSIDNSISGRLLSSDGKPLADVWVYLLAVGGKPTNWGKKQEKTEKDGSFKFDEIDEGTYVLLLNDEGEVRGSYPYPTFYYPGTVVREAATVIKVGPGDFLANFTLKAPPPAATITISGLVVFEDGRPADYESVDFRVERSPSPGYRSPEGTALTGKDGRFSIKVLRGQNGAVYSSYSPSKWDFEDCPERLDAVLAKADANGRYETQHKMIDASADVTGIVLTLPVTICKKRK